MHTHYDNLKVARGAPAEVIKAAYRALSQRYHPDRNASPDAERVMRLLNEAYAVLGDAARRAAYDEELGRHEPEPEQPDRPFASADAAPASQPGDGAGAGEGEGGSAMGRFASAVASAYALRRPVAPALGVAVTRCAARLFDVGWEAGAIGFVVALFLDTHWEAFSEWLAEPGNPVLFAMLCMPVAMVLDASVCRVAGNTPGKALLGLKVTALDGGRLSWRSYLRRNLAVWARGLGCGIPFVNLVAMWRRGREVSAGADAAYDVKTGHQVSVATIGRARKAVFGGVCVALLSAVPAIRPAVEQRMTDPPAPKVAAVPRPHLAKASAPPARSSSWTNPRTGNTATVDGLWRVSSAVTADRATVYTFRARDGHTTVMFADQDMPNLSMGEYVLSYLRNTAPSMNLTTPDSVDHSGISDTWIANGHLTDKPAVAVHVELRHIGQSFWRMVVIRPPEVQVANDAVDRLVQRLWETVPGV